MHWPIPFSKYSRITCAQSVVETQWFKFDLCMQTHGGSKFKFEPPGVCMCKSKFELSDLENVCANSILSDLLVVLTHQSRFSNKPMK